MNVENVKIYRKDSECRAIVREVQQHTEHVVRFSAGRSVSFRKCAERALNVFLDAHMVHGAKYSGEFVDEFPLRVDDEFVEN